MESTTQITAWMGFTTTVAAGCELRFAGMLQESSTGGAKLKKQSRTAYGPKSISLRTFPPARSTLRLIRLILSSDTIEYLPGKRSSCRPWSWRGCVGPRWILITQDLAFDSKRIRVVRAPNKTRLELCPGFARSRHLRMLGFQFHEIYFGSRCFMASD